jgi:hypothetical protein
VSGIAALAMKRGKSVDFTDYWQGHIADQSATPRSRKQKDPDQQTCRKCPEAQCASRDKADENTEVLRNLVGLIRHGSRSAFAAIAGAVLHGRAASR